MNKGFTLIELVVVIGIIAILSGIILFSITEYISRGKDSNVSASLAILIPAGEVWYNGNGEKYNDEITDTDFCNPDQNSVIKNALLQMPQNSNPNVPCHTTAYTATTNPQGVCCNASSQAWVACAIKFTDSNMAFCVDSRGVKGDILASECNANMPTECPPN